MRITLLTAIEPTSESASPQRASRPARRRNLLQAVLLAALLSLTGVSARADIILNFDFSGTLANPYRGNGSVTGMFTLDLTTASITGFDFATPVVTIDPSNGFTASVFTYTPAVDPDTDFVQLFFGDHKGLGDYLNLFFQTGLASFSGSTFYIGPVEIYPGGYSDTGLECYGAPSACAQPAYGSTFTGGSATPVGAVPEPGALSQFVLGCAVLGLAAGLFSSQFGGPVQHHAHSGVRQFGGAFDSYKALAVHGDGGPARVEQPVRHANFRRVAELHIYGHLLK
jgi:hypothetical protein